MEQQNHRIIKIPHPHPAINYHISSKAIKYPEKMKKINILSMAFLQNS